MTLTLDLVVQRGPFTLEAALTTTSSFTVLVGPSGAGKSTLLDCLDGSLRIDRGSIEIAGRTVSGPGVHLPPHRRRTPRVYQDGRLFPHLKVEDNLRYGMREGGLPLADVTRALEIDDLRARAPGSLSGGERQRVAIGRALLAGPDLLLLDEPLASLDRPLRRRILPHLRRWLEAFGVPAIYVTHDPWEALQLDAEVVRLQDGAIAQIGPAHRVLAHDSGAPPPSLTEDDTVLRVRVEDHDPEGRSSACRLGSLILTTAHVRAVPGETVFLAVSCRDVVLAPAPVAGVSARNAIDVEVLEVMPRDDDVLAILEITAAPEAPALHASLTPRAVRELGVAPGTSWVAVLKSAALRPL